MRGRSAASRRRWCEAACLLVLLPWPAPSPAQAILEREVTDPRSFGYVIGDRLRRDVRLSVAAGYRLDAATLPEAGRLDRWLELAAPEVRSEQIQGGTRYRLILTYQIVNAPRTPEVISLPQQNLRIVGETQALTALVPALRVTVAPLTSSVPDDRLTAASLQQDREPGPLAVEARQSRLAWTAAALLCLVLLASWRQGVKVFLERRRLPFATAVRALEQRSRASGATDDRAASLKIVHDAVNRTAGHAVFAHNLDAFLAARPEYAPLRGDFEQLFAASDGLFFANRAEAEASAGLPSLLRLCRLCSRIERRSAGAGTDAAAA